MRFTRALIYAFLVFLVLFGLRLAFVSQMPSPDQAPQYGRVWSDFALSKNNYASGKMSQVMNAPMAQSLGNIEKYERVASLGQTTRSFDNDQEKLVALIGTHQGTVQYESATGLPGQRHLNLGIGIPPNEFDGFIASAKQIGQLTHLSIVKNDKTNEYMALRAKRNTLEKARSAVEALRQLNASVDERLNVEQRFNQIEDEIQQLGVSLGEFDAQNEFYTVKLSLQEVRAPIVTSLYAKVFNTLVWTAKVYAALSLGLLAFATALWVGIPVVRGVFHSLKRLHVHKTTPVA